MSTLATDPSHKSTTAPSATSVEPQKSFLGRVIRGLPTLVTFVLLGAVGWAGHHFGWKLPKASDLAANGVIASAKQAWCAEHNVPEDQCVECRKDLLPATANPEWCKLHGVSECPTCRPELAQLAGPAKLPQYDTVAAIGQFQRVENNSRCRKFLTRIQFESMAAFEKALIDVDVARERPMVESLQMNGELGYDQTQLAHLSTRVPGTVWKVFKRQGDEVRVGDVIALVDAVEVGKAKSELGRAVVHRQLKQKALDAIRKAGASSLPERTVREAEAAHEEAYLQVVLAQQALINLGFQIPKSLDQLDAEHLTRKLQGLGLTDEWYEKISSGGSMTMNLIPIIAPQQGMIVEMDIVAGEVVSPDRALVTLTDLRQLWLTLHVKQEDAKYVQVGQMARFQPDGGRDAVSGRVEWVSPAVDPVTRTLKVRVALPNENFSLKANGFGTGWIVLREELHAIAVPKEALQWEGDCHVVFVRDKNFLKEGSPKVFHIRQVRIGAKSDSHVELLAGVLPGEVVATKGSTALKAQLLKNSLGDGCGCGH